MVHYLGSRMVAFSKAVVLGYSEIEGQKQWVTLKDLVATSPDSWEPSSKPAN
jgi:hypothetical protein